MRKQVERCRAHL